MFKEIKSSKIAEFDGVATLYKHECGMEVLHIKNDSEELSANFIFSTESEDSTGVAHIIEHTVLCGSERFPVKDPFSQIMITSPNTFLNAMTFPDKTMYPFASPLKKDFDIIFDIYADAVFAPLLRKESFNQEGVRFCTGKIDGVVFNEMCGAYSSEDEFVSSYSVRKLFEGTPAAYESGGDPKYIPDLTYEDYIARYKKWYSPANCRMFLYGNLNPQEYMDKIESRYLTQERLRNFSSVTLSVPSKNYLNPNAKPTYDTEFCPTKDASDVLLNWLTTESSNPFEILTLSILVEILLGNPGAPLYKALVESGLGDDLNPCSGMTTDFPILAFSVGLSGAKENCEKQIETFILKELKKYVSEGLDINLQKSCLKRQKFKLQEIPGSGYPYSVLSGIRASRFWLRGCDPIEGLRDRDLFSRLEQEFAKGHFFENWIQKNLVDNPRRCLLTVKEDPNYDASLKKMLAEKYETLKKNCGDRQYLEDKEKFEKFVATEDDEEDLKRIPRIAKEDLPERIPKFSLTGEKIGGADVEHMNAFTRGISYFNIAFDATCLTEEELGIFPLLTRAYQMCGTTKHSFEEIGVMINMLTGSFSVVNTSGAKQNGNPAVYLAVKASALDEDACQALGLIREILLDVNLLNTDRISATITDLVTDYESEYLYSGHIYSNWYSMSNLNHINRVSDLLNGTAGYLFAKKYQNASKTQLKELAEKMNSINKKIVCRSKMIFEYCCEEKSNNTVAAFVDKNIMEYPEGTKDPVASFYNTEFKADYGHKFLSVSNGPAYNSMACILPAKDERSLVCASLASSIFNSGYILENVRGKGGAYGAGCHVDMTEKALECYSYRDPNIEKTFEWYLNAYQSEIKQKDIDYTVASIIGKELKPFVPKAKNYEAFRRYLYGLDDALYIERRKYLLSIGVEDLQRTCEEIYKELKNRSAKTTICGKEMINNSGSDIITIPV